MSTVSQQPSSKSLVCGLLAFACGAMLLISGVLQRNDGRLSWGPRNGPMQTLAREENPRFFDRVTYGLIGAGLLISVGGLVVAYRHAPRGKSISPM